jgi:glyoxylase-like metal-dependent hydrolase (beta-lactamase superfamily II)
MKTMMHWNIQVLDYGYIECPKEAITVGVDLGMMIKLPYLGFLLYNDDHRVLVDCGINERYIIDGKAWGNFPAAGGTQYVVDSLEKYGTKPEEIEMVLYTHLHNDHTGACHLFKNAKHVFQYDEWSDLVDPLPSMMIRGDFDQAVIPLLKDMKRQRIEGDLEIMNGIKMIKTPGHTAGSSCFAVSTEKGDYVITGDTAIIRQNLFPHLTETMGIDGKKIVMSPAPENYGPAIPSSLVYNHYEWYKSIYKIQAMLKSEQFALCGHEPAIFNKLYPD